MPPEPPDDEIRYIPLTQGKYAIVDAADYKWLSQWKWCAVRSGNCWYAYRKRRRKTIRMHQVLMNPPDGMIVDHINGNGLDNRRVNLRICTRRENAWNHGRRKPENASSQFIGVFRDKRAPGKCHVRVTRDGQATKLGPFDDEIEAARVRDRIARELHGDFAWLNFPEEADRPPEPSEAPTSKESRPPLHDEAQARCPPRCARNLTTSAANSPRPLRAWKPADRIRLWRYLVAPSGARSGVVRRSSDGPICPYEHTTSTAEPRPSPNPPESVYRPRISPSGRSSPLISNSKFVEHRKRVPVQHIELYAHIGQQNPVS